MATDRGPTSIRLSKELHKRVLHECVDREITMTDAIHTALEAWLLSNRSTPGLPGLEIPPDETLLMRVEEAGHAIDVLLTFVNELKHAATPRILEAAGDGGTGEEEGRGRGTVAGSGGGTGEEKAS